MNATSGKPRQWPPKAGDSFRDIPGEHGRLFHVRGMVDDDQCVMRTWLKHKKRWRYFVEGPSYFHHRGWLFEEHLVSVQDESTP